MVAITVHLIASLSSTTTFTALPAERAEESVAVIAVGEPPRGPSAELAELAHQLRAALRDRARCSVEDVSAMRARFDARSSPATLAALERAYVGAQAAFQADELDSALRTFRGIASDLERLPESDEAFGQSLRVQLRIALAERAMGRRAEMDAAMEHIASVEPSFIVDPEQFAPSFRRDFDEVRRRLEHGPKRTLTITSPAPVTAFVNGKDVGTTPAVIALPPGRYRVGGTAGDIRTPTNEIVLETEDRTVELDAALADAVRVDAGPGLALASADRPSAVVRAGRWLQVDRVVAIALETEGDRSYLTASLYDVGRDELARAARIAVGTPLATPAIGSLASFLLTGDASADVTQLVPVPTSVHPAASAFARGGPTAGAASLDGVRTTLAANAPVDAPPTASAPRWLRPASYAAAVAAVALTAFGVQQALSARESYSGASGLLRTDGALVAGADRSRYDAAVASGDAANRNAYLGAAGAVLCAAAAGVLGYLSSGSTGVPGLHF